MKLETLKSFKLKKLILPVVIVLCLIIVITTFTSKSKYVYVDSIPIIDGTVNYTPYQYKIIKQYKQKDTCTDTSSSDCYEEVPIDTELTDYELNEEKTYYYVDYEEQKVTGAITLNADGSINADNLPMRSKCFLYFDKKGEDLGKKTYEQLLALNKDLQSKGTLPATFTSVCDNADCSGVYEAPDDDGTSYYFRGVVENNYVKFGKMGSTSSGADIWWRIIRINGDGTIRMIFAGTGGSAPTQTGSGTTIGYYVFNNSYDRAEYVGFEYQDNIRNGNSKDTSGQKSNALQTLESWFATNLEDELKAGYIDENAGFCADRTAYEYSSPYNRNDNLGTVKQQTRYGAVIRNYPNAKSISTSNPAKPSFQCPDIKNDLFTYTGSSQGTQSLRYPIGLITVDEATYAGGLFDGSNSKYYLYNGQYYWTMSPSLFAGSAAIVFRVGYDGNLRSDRVSGSNWLRPVLNIKADIIKWGNGTSSNPFSTVEDCGDGPCEERVGPV